MKILVTGAGGFIGKHLVKTLVQAGHEVIGLDIADTPALYLDTPLIKADITQPLEPIPNLDAVIHLAAMANPRECDASPAKAFDVNINGTYQVLRMALESGAKKFIFPSSAHVYDIPPRYFPTDETHPLRLNNTYTTSKILGEQLCELFWTNHGLSYTVLRLYNVYGPGQALGYFIPDMISKARNGGIVLPGGNTTKDFVFVEDVAQAFRLALDTPYVGHINIGTGRETELSSIAARLAIMMKVSFSTTPNANATRMQADVSRAKRVLRWEPVVTVTEGLAHIYQSEVVGVKA